MNKLIILTALVSLFSFTNSQAQIKNAKTVTVKVSGNCGMCETTIEKAADEKKISKADWNKDTKMATITYNSKKTDLNAVLKNIALAGYDNEQFLAPDAAYNKLHGCCKYDRVLKTETAVMPTKEATKDADMHKGHNHAAMDNAAQDKNQLSSVFENYFAVKDALVKTDAALASTSATALQTAIGNVKMDKLPMNVHTEWMKQLEGLKQSAEAIKAAKDIAAQRKQFISLTDNVYALIKIAQPEEAVYYQHCPMANGGKGANWLSKENAVKNPYYGNKMLTCGSVVETIK